LKFELLMENWNTFLSEGRESKALYQAMVDAAPDGKWWKLKPSHHTRKAYRAYLDRKGGFETKTPAVDEDDWDFDEDLGTVDPRAAEASEKGWVLTKFNEGFGCIEYWYTDPATGDKMGPRLSRYCEYGEKTLDDPSALGQVVGAEIE